MSNAVGNVPYLSPIGTQHVIDKTAPTVSSIMINDGSAQRSRVTSITVTFSEIVTLPGTPANAFQLARTGPGAPLGNVTIAGVDTTGSTPTQTVAKLTFSGALTEFTSLIDGRYTLSVLGAQFSDAAGNAGMSASQNLHRLFGDSNADATVAANDFIQFRLALGGNSAIFDFDNDGAVAASDFIQFRLRFGGSV